MNATNIPTERRVTTQSAVGTGGDLNSVERMPCTFSQVAHWRLRRLDQEPSYRQIVSALLVRGHFDVERFKRSVLAIVRRHDALRTRIVMQDKAPIQEVLAHPTVDWAVSDQTTLPQSDHQARTSKEIREFVLQPVNIAADPLLGVRVVQFSAEEHLVIVGMEHAVSDMRSLGIFLEEVFSCYCTGELAPVATQFSEYALRQQSADRAALAKNGLFLIQRLGALTPLRFPQIGSTVSTSGCGKTSFVMGEDLKALLRAASRDLRTTVPMLGFAAYAAAVLSVCEATCGTFKCVTDGRRTADLRRVIGFLACPLYLGISLSDDSTFATLIKLVTEEYCRAYQHADHFYLESLSWRPAFLASHAFNWIPEPSSAIEPSPVMRDEISIHPIFVDNPLYTRWSLDSDTAVLFVERRHDIVGQLLYRDDRVSRALAEHFAASFAPYIKALLEKPHAPLTQTRILRK